MSVCCSHVSSDVFLSVFSLPEERRQPPADHAPETKALQEQDDSGLQDSRSRSHRHGGGTAVLTRADTILASTHTSCSSVICFFKWASVKARWTLIGCQCFIVHQLETLGKQEGFPVLFCHCLNASVRKLPC